MKGFVYILEDDAGVYYVGSTVDVDFRYEKQHLKGRTQTTSKMLNPKIVLRQEYPTIEQARRIEMKIKRLKRKDYIKKMVTEGRITMK